MVFTAWIVAHPYESLVALGAILSLVNGALPASVQRGPVGRVLHTLLDRLAVLARRDAPGTLKWPGVASAVLAPPVPPSVGPLAPPSDQSGHVEGAAMLGACVVALAASLACAGCPWVREGAARATVTVTDPRDCVPLATRCVAGVPVVCSPTPVPGSVLHREWPMLPRDGRGMQRGCASGCVVDDAGAHCVDGVL